MPEPEGLRGGSEAAGVLAERMDAAASGPLGVAEPAGIPMLVARLAGGYRVAFTTRHGGVSGGSHGTLNLSSRTGDDETAVAENRSRVASALRLLEKAEHPEAPADSGEDREEPPALVSPRQVHGVRVVGAAEYAAGPPDAPADGLTVHAERERGVAALLLFADCVPVVLSGEVDAAVVHGGWRGLVGGVVQEGARALAAPPGAAVVGPSIGPCCYQVGQEVRRMFSDRYGAGVIVEDRVDLWLSAERALQEVGVPASNVWNPRLCTKCNSDLFFSHRGSGGATGRQGALAWAVGGMG